MQLNRRSQAIALVVVMVAFMVISNTVGDGTSLGGIAFLMWVLAALALIGLGIRSAVEQRRQRPGGR